MPLASRLRRLRRAQGLSQNALARAAGLKQPTIACMELRFTTGQRVTYGSYSRLVTALGLLDIDDLLYGTIDEIVGALALDDEEEAIRAANEMMQDMQHAGKRGRAEAVLERADMDNWPVAVIVALADASHWLSGSQTFRLFLFDCKRLLREQIGQETADELIKIPTLV